MEPRLYCWRVCWKQKHIPEEPSGTTKAFHMSDLSAYLPSFSKLNVWYDIRDSEKNQKVNRWVSMMFEYYRWWGEDFPEYLRVEFLTVWALIPSRNRSDLIRRLAWIVHNAVNKTVRRKCLVGSVVYLFLFLIIILPKQNKMIRWLNRDLTFEYTHII